MKTLSILLALSGMFAIGCGSELPEDEDVSEAVSPLVGQTEFLVNPGFEQGATGWSGSTGDIGDWAAYGEPAYQGTKSCYLGGYGTVSTEVIYQTVTIPANVIKLTLSFALHIDTAETSLTTGKDRLTVSVENTSHIALQTLGQYSNLNASSGYVLHQFDLLAYKGQTVNLKFSATENSSLQTSFVLDAVSLSGH